MQLLYDCFVITGAACCRIWQQQWQSHTTYSRYTFSAKEKPACRNASSGRDDETQYSYFGARYYDSDLSVWLSVDPLSDKYPNLSPYAYCANNPVIIVDPDGNDWFMDESTGAIRYHSDYGQTEAGLLGENFKWIGKNGMFGETQEEMQNIIDNNPSSADFAYNTETKGLDGEITKNQNVEFFSINKAKKFLNSHGYSLKPLEANVHVEETNKFYGEPHMSLQQTTTEEFIEKVFKWTIVNNDNKGGDYKVLSNYKRTYRDEKRFRNFDLNSTYVEHRFERRLYDYTKRGDSQFGDALFKTALEIIKNVHNF